MPEHAYPIFRKLANGASVFRIGSDTTFTEVQRIGKRLAVFTIVAHTWPERLRIQDMVLALDGSVRPCEEAEFNEWLLSAQGGQRT